MKTTASRDKGGSSARIESRGERIFDIAVKVIGIVLIILCLYPLYYVIIASISRPLYVENGQVMFTPVMPTLESFREAFQTPWLWTSFGNSIFYTLAGVLVNMVFSTTMAYALSRPRLIFRKFFTLLAVFTMWFSAGIIPMYMTFRDFHLLDTRIAIIFGFAISTYNMIRSRRRPSSTAPATSASSPRSICRSRSLPWPPSHSSTRSTDGTATSGR